MFDTFNFAPGNNRRIIAVLVAAVVVLFLMLFRLQGHSDQSERAIRQLVEALGVERFDWDEAATRVAGGPKIVTISPAFNEAENVGAVIEAMPKEVAGYAVIPIVVDDCSDDGTDEAARAAGALAARLPIRRGGGLALRVGYDIALKLGADIVVTLDADGQHLPEEIPILVAPIIEDRADHVNGSRMLGDYEGGHSVRSAGVHFFSRVVTMLTGSASPTSPAGTARPGPTPLRKLILVQDQFWTSRGHDRGVATARAHRRGAGDVPHPPRRRVEEAEDRALRLELLQGDRQDLAPIGRRRLRRRRVPRVAPAHGARATPRPRPAP